MDSMDLDLDPFADLVPQKTLNHVRVGGKFQPRGKPRPGKPTSNAKEKCKSSLPTPLDMVESAGFSVASSPLIEKEEILGNKTTSEIEGPDSSDALSLKVNEDSSLLSDSLQPDFQSLDVPNSCANEAKEPLNDNDGLCLDELDSMDTTNLENGASDDNKGWSSSFMKSTEVGSLGLELDPLSDAPILPAVDNARVGGKFKPKAKVQPKKRASEEAIIMPISSGSMEEPTKVATLENLVIEEPLRNEDYTNSEAILSTDQHSGFGKQIGENADIFLGLEYIHDFETQSPNNIEIPLPTSNDEETEEQCSFPTKNSINSSILRACNTVGPESVVREGDGRLESEFQESGPFFNVERPDFLPDSVNVYESCSRKFQPKPKVQNGKENLIVTNVPRDGAGYENEGLIPTFPSDEILDYSSMSFSDFVPTTAELPMNEEQIEVAESSRNLRKRAASQQFVEEPEDETRDNDYDYDYRVDENEDDDEEEDRTEITSPKKKASKKSQTPAAKNQTPGKRRKKNNDVQEHSTSKKSQVPSAKNKNPGRRRKRDNDVQEHSTQVPQKKFSHSTLRKRRLKELLVDTPEDDVDFQGRALKDIILLGEHKDNLAVKNAKESKNASTGQRSNNSTHGEESLNEEDGLASEQDGTGSAIDQSNVLFNHNSFMDKTPRSRWSKEDTEKFYEVIRQFGTDLSMIQQLFPGKTRHQLKLKLKKEDRQYPSRLNEALRSRPKDNSYFKKLIDQYNLVVQHEPNKDGSACASDEEAELNPDTYEDSAKTEHKQDMIREDVGDGGRVQSPKNDEDEEEDDMDIWNSYQSVY